MARKKAPRRWGQIEYLPSGVYRARYTGPDKKRYDAGELFPEKITAEAWLEAQRLAIRDGRWTAESAEAQREHRSVTLGEYASRWMDVRRNRRGEPLRARTRAEYERMLRLPNPSKPGDKGGPLAPLAVLPLRSLTADKVTRWYQEQIATGSQTQTARAYGLLASITKTAVLQKALAEPVCQIRGGGNATTGKRVEPPTPAELQRIVDEITPSFRAAVVIAAWAGTRYGELTELRRKDLVIVRGPDRAVQSIVVNVTRAVTNTTGIGFQVGKTKSEAGVRSIALPPHTFPVVLDHLRDFTADFPESLLFPSSDGVKHLAQTAFYRHWDRARTAAGREDMPFHALRHYGATRAALAGATLKELQTRLGHSTVAAAMRYQHTAGRDEELARRMSELA